MIRSLIGGFSGSTPTSWVIRSAPGTGSLYVVGFNGSNLFVTININRNVYTSPDGVTWTTAATGILIFPYGITYSGTAFIIVGTDSNTGYPGIATSTDGGVTWTTRSTSSFGTTASIYDICWSGTYLVAVSSEGHIATSTNTGSSWTQRYNDASSNFYSVAYGGGIYVACGSNCLVTSTNGTSWTNNTSTYPKFSVRSVTYGNSKFVAVGGSGKIATSTDGINWTNRTSPFGTTNISKVTYGNSRFVAVGDSGKIATSTDGINWNLSESPVTTMFRGVVYGNSKFVAVGGGSPTIITSPTGL